MRKLIADLSHHVSADEDIDCAFLLDTGNDPIVERCVKPLDGNYVIYRFGIEPCDASAEWFADWARRQEILADFKSDNMVTRALAYLMLGEYHGFENLDSYPLTVTREQFEDRYYGILDECTEAVDARYPTVRIPEGRYGTRSCEISARPVLCGNVRAFGFGTTHAEPGDYIAWNETDNGPCHVGRVLGAVYAPSATLGKDAIEEYRGIAVVQLGRCATSAFFRFVDPNRVVEIQTSNYASGIRWLASADFGFENVENNMLALHHGIVASLKKS
jgi:hypothetical protein